MTVECIGIFILVCLALLAIASRGGKHPPPEVPGPIGHPESVGTHLEYAIQYIKMRFGRR